MAGKRCTGQLEGNSKQTRLSKAYAEGRIAAIAAYPGAAPNPHPVNTPANLAWKRGLDTYAGPGAAALPQDCVAESGTGVPFLDLDGDGLEDHLVAGIPGTGTPVVYEDDDSYNIDIDGDGDIDIEIHKP